MSWPGLLASYAKDGTEEIGEYILHLIWVNTRAAGETAILIPVEVSLRAASLPARVIASKPVIMGAFLGITEHLIGFVDFLKTFLRLFVIWVAVGMVLHRKLAICLADLIFTGFAIHTQNFVVIFVVHKDIVTPRQMLVKRLLG